MSGRVYISLGNNVDLWIDENNHLLITKKWVGRPNDTIDLGFATDSRIATLMTYLQRLRVHAIKDGPHQ